MEEATVVAIMKELAKAKRWTTIELCTAALENVRRIADDIAKDCAPRPLVTGGTAEKTP